MKPTIEAQIIERFGYLPAFFVPALNQPQTLESLWQHCQSAYLNNPLPELFKEKLATLLSRDSSVSYLVIFHSGRLKKLGFTSPDLLKIIQRPAPELDQVFVKINGLISSRAYNRNFPEPNSAIEDAVLSCCVGFFARRQTNECQMRLRELLSRVDYQNVCQLMNYIRSNIMWVESYPENRQPR